MERQTKTVHNTSLHAAKKYTFFTDIQQYLYITVIITHRNNSTIFCQQKVSHLIWYAFQIQHASLCRGSKHELKKTTFTITTPFTDKHHK